MMNFDIENLDRKTPYKTPDHFFDTLQDKVIQETIGKKKQARVIPMYTKWAIAASVTLFAGLSAFFISTQNEEVSIANNTVIIDSTYKTNQALATNKDFTETPKSEIVTQNNIVETNNDPTLNKIDNTEQKSIRQKLIR